MKAPMAADPTPMNADEFRKAERELPV